jgi:hypothetical protein
MALMRLKPEHLSFSFKASFNQDPAEKFNRNSRPFASQSTNFNLEDVKV